MHLQTLVRLNAHKVYDHLYPLLENPHLTKLTVTRYAPIPYEHEKLDQCYFLEDGVTLTTLQRIGAQLRVWWVAYCTARQERPDVIYGIFASTYGIMAWVVAKALRRKILLTFIGTDLNKHVLEYASQPVLLWFIRRTDAMTVFDEAAKQKLVALNVPAERIFVLSHAIEAERFIRDDHAPQDLDVVFVGSLIPLKEVGLLIAAWQHVVHKLPNARLGIVGDGDLRESLAQQARQLGIFEHVEFIGWVDDVVPHLSRAKVFANLSNQEGVPHAMIESMVCGLVPVVTDVGGVPSVIQDRDNGFLIANPADPKTVAERIITLLTDPEKYHMMQKAAMSIREQHTYEVVRDEWTPILDYLRDC